MAAYPADARSQPRSVDARSVDNWVLRTLSDAPGTSRMTVDERAAMTISCRDTDDIPKVADAGGVRVTPSGTQVQVMHNGTVVEAGGYYGDWMATIIRDLRGHHEPQEERVFFEVLARVEAGSTMIELGAFWAYYSLWFASQVPRGRAICCEPDPRHLELGRRNAALNSLAIEFFQGAAGAQHRTIVDVDMESEPGEAASVPILSVDGLMDELDVERVDLLHMDVQGAELDALVGASRAIERGCLRFVLVSTHHYSISGDPNIHAKCLRMLTERGAHVISSHTVLESFSGDGLIAVSFDPRDRDLRVPVSLNHTDQSLFRPHEEDLELLIEAAGARSEGRP